MVNSHIKKCLFVFFILVHWAVAFSCTSDDEALEVVELSVNKEVVDFKCEAGHAEHNGFDECSDLGGYGG